MYAIPQHPYAFGPHMSSAMPLASVPSRQYANHSNSSAFSSSANADEDWTKISDLAERRRIQNRIAQRNYRKKLKRRLEEIESRAAADDMPLPSVKSLAGARAGGIGATGKSGKPKKQQHTLSSLSAAEAAQQQHRQQHRQQAQQQHQQARQTQKPIKQELSSQFTPPMQPDDDLGLFSPTAAVPGSSAAYDDPQHLHYSQDRARSHSYSHSPPSLFSSSVYSSYPPPPDDVLLGGGSGGSSSSSSHGDALPLTSSSMSPMSSMSAMQSMASSPAHHPYGSHGHAATAYEYNNWSMTSGLPVSLPSMDHHVGTGMIKHGDSDDAVVVTDGMVAQSYVNYNLLMASGIDAANPYGTNPHTPPLSSSYDHSTSCSDAGYDYPTTPSSMPGSPSMML